MPQTFSWEETPDGHQMELQITMREDGTCRIMNLKDKNQSFETESTGEAGRAITDLLITRK